MSDLFGKRGNKSEYGLCIFTGNTRTVGERGVRDGEITANEFLFSCQKAKAPDRSGFYTCCEGREHETRHTIIVRSDTRWRWNLTKLSLANTEHTCRNHVPLVNKAFHIVTAQRNMAPCPKKHLTKVLVCFIRL